MKGRPIDQLVYEYMFPKPRQSDPQSFHALLQRHLILEVRQEVHSFYGHLDTQEAKYPGLDYTRPIHRIRLSRWQWHRRLFRAFDNLHLTNAEIASLTKWEGTKWAKERFEREQGITIRDTTDDDFAQWIEPEDRPAARAQRALSQETEERSVIMAEAMAADEESDEELESVAVPLNEQLREQIALRNASGDLSTPLDPEFENWLKNAIESGELPHVADQIARLSGPQSSLTADDIFPVRFLAAARAGHWNEIPGFYHDVIRHVLETESHSRRMQSAVSASSSGHASSGLAPLNVANIFGPEQRRTFSDLRLPVGSDGNGPTAQSGIRVQRTARPGA
ncbi:hypothetical protein B0H66DRAFT_596900 [Apodospora peruviana]|uniref:Uncharacterized protein n=1 Tax=Apodospora peruviana TaxID=516989 RepID=A0AAE0IQK1_9PEZI|nr:hypothetical protein B0H66DRAFT_596900 [Apodospora peruviana]